MAIEMIARDPALLRTYEQNEKAESDWNSGIYDARQEGEQIGENQVLELMEQGYTTAQIKAKLAAAKKG
jgi:hypothetical protein